VPRNRGAEIDVAGRRVRDRDGQWHAITDLAVAASGLYFVREPDEIDAVDPHRGRLRWPYERWLLPDAGWTATRHALPADHDDRLDWYIEPEIITATDAGWAIRDAYIDVRVYEGQRYLVDDADEFAEALAAGEMSVEEAVVTLQSLDRLCRALQRLRFSGHALLREFAPGLPGARA
jgi:predicted RNA-binding protein associated with RNAse of E/G family